MGVLWTVRRGEIPLIEEFEDFLACYDPLGGNTHLFDAFSGEILKLVISGTLTQQQILDCLALQMGDDKREWAANVDKVLRNLQQLGLIDSRIV